MDTADYLDVFIDESREHLDVLYKQLLELENHPTEMSIIEEIFRAAHTLKGMAATMGYENLANLTHKLENIFDGIRDEKIQVSTEMMDVLFDSVDDLNEMVEDISGGGNGSRDIKDTLETLNEIEMNELVKKTESVTLIGENNLDTNSLVKHLDEFEVSIVKESIERGFINYEIIIKMSKDCLLKGARTFMVFNVLEEMGEIIKSDPPVQELEEENFDLLFTVLFISKRGENEIKQKILKVSEIEEVTILDFTSHKINIEQEKFNTQVEYQE